jgi:N-acetylneuraminate synthase
MQSIKIQDFMVGREYRPFIIAEMSGNHNHSLDRALAIVDAAADAGVQAVKLQTYTADTMTIDINEGEFRVDDPASLWQGRSLYQLYQEAYTPWEWHEPIFKRCRERGIVAFSTPFDPTAVDFLEELKVPCYKIASFEMTDLPLIRKVAATGKPMIMSTGMASVAELDEAVRTAREHGCRDIILLKCTSTYPADPGSSHLRTLAHLRELFDCEVGLSDHTLGIGAAVASVALGAAAIEKHVTLSRGDGGVDAAFSLEPPEMRMLVAETLSAWQSLGEVRYGPIKEERQSLLHRRSLYFVADMGAGEVITPEHVRNIRPGLGLPPKFIDMVIGRRTKESIKRGTPVRWEALT